jgi:L-ascorbate metabolism protein UlaG (beta-lactamase superfamily)
MEHTDVTNYDGKRFFNPSGAHGKSFRSVPRLMVTPRARWPRRVPLTPVKPPRLAATSDVVVTFIGHSTFLIQSARGNILTDPQFSKRASPLQFIGPRRVREPAVRFDDLPAIAVVLLSHNHYDHCDLTTLRRLAERFDPVVVTPLRNAPLVRSTGIREIEELDWFQSASRTPFPVTLVPAQHFSARTPFDRNRALWGSFIFELSGHRIYFAGDTGYGPHFAQTRERVGAVDLALLPIGAYEPRWFMKDIHMNPDEAVRAHLHLGATQSIGMHFGTFQLTPEGIDAPVQALEAAKRERRIPPEKFRVLGFGESLLL